MKTTGVYEWAKSSINILSGCQHDCKYCYAKAMAVRFGRCDIAKWCYPTVNEKVLNKKISKKDGTIMFPSTHDIHPENLHESIYFLGKLLRAGNNVLIVSKPHVKCIDDLTHQLLQFRDQILFRFTIGSIFNNVLKFWEPNAPDLSERLDSLQICHERGFKTSISIEPMLDDETDSVILMTKQYVTDSIWIGKMNNFANITLNGHDSPEMKTAIKKIKDQQSDENIKELYWYFKDDPIIKWKDSIKKIVGIKLNSKKGADL
ncbi:hypothetical protein KAR91_59100 [Candidatus Pacearchaeota archaeon]|nr:hypothetical protein [Candidatus Pacearchaeota archaeon]